MSFSEQDVLDLLSMLKNIEEHKKEERRNNVQIIFAAIFVILFTLVCLAISFYSMYQYGFYGEDRFLTTAIVLMIIPVATLITSLVLCIIGSIGEDN